MSGLAALLAAVLVAWFIIHMLVERIPTIGQVRDRPREDGIQRQWDAREVDPRVVQDTRFWTSLDPPHLRYPDPDDPARPH